MDILYSKELKTDEKNENISGLEYFARVRVDNGDDETTHFDGEEQKTAIVEELMRRALLEIENILQHHLRRKSVKDILHQHKISGTTTKTIIDEISRKKYSLVKKLQYELADIS